MECENEKQRVAAQIFARDALGRAWSESPELTGDDFIIHEFKWPWCIIYLDWTNTISRGRPGENVRQIEWHLKPIFLQMAEERIAENSEQ